MGFSLGWCKGGEQRLLCAALKGVFGRDRSELEWRRGFFLLEDGKIRRPPLVCTRLLLLAASSQKPFQDREIPSSLCLPTGSFQAGTRRADRQHGAPKLVSLPPSPIRRVHEEGEESPARSGSCKPEADFQHPFPWQAT